MNWFLKSESTARCIKNLNKNHFSDEKGYQKYIQRELPTYTFSFHLKSALNVFIFCSENECSVWQGFTFRWNVRSGIHNINNIRINLNFFFALKFYRAERKKWLCNCYLCTDVSKAKLSRKSIICCCYQKLKSATCFFAFRNAIVQTICVHSIFHCL